MNSNYNFAMNLERTILILYKKKIIVSSNSDIIEINVNKPELKWMEF